MSSLIIILVFCSQVWSQIPTNTPVSNAPAVNAPSVPPQTPPPVPVPESSQPLQPPPPPPQMPNGESGSVEMNQPPMQPGMNDMIGGPNNSMNGPGANNSSMSMGGASGFSILPDEVITIKPYYKNKPRLGRLIAELYATPSQQLISKIESEFGDCKNCSRGVSIKSKIGIRFYGDNINTLKVSRKNATSIKLLECPYQLQLDKALFTCEFRHKNQNYRMVIRFEP